MPITALLSILHRGTGAVLFIGLLLMIAILVSLTNGTDSWQTMHHFLSSGLGKLIVFGFSFSLYYHCCNGIRHLFWDIGKGLSRSAAHRSAWFVLASAVALTLITWIITSL
jgi:succinate dehydrogenase / fumarate reductase cytochrome b subunit